MSIAEQRSNPLGQSPSPVFGKSLPGWQEKGDFCEIDIPCAYPERSRSFADRAASRMRSVGFSGEAITGFQVAFGEAVSNAFEHGCAEGSQSVTLRSEVTHEYTSFTVINTDGRVFDLNRELNEAAERLSKDPSSRRGRGLIHMQNLCDHLTSVENGRGIKGVFERDQVLYSVTHVGEIAVATLLNGIENLSFERRTVAVVAAESERDVILNFSQWSTGGTKIYSVILDAEKILSGSRKHVVALLYPTSKNYFSPIYLLEDVVAYDAHAALAKLGHLELESQVMRVIQEAKNSSRSL